MSCGLSAQSASVTTRTTTSWTQPGRGGDGLRRSVAGSRHASSSLIAATASPFAEAQPASGFEHAPASCIATPFALLVAWQDPGERQLPSRLETTATATGAGARGWRASRYPLCC